MADAILAQGCIYAILNIKTLTRYVGQTSDIKRRWRAHQSLLRTKKHHSIVLQRSFDKHGEGAFEFEVLEWCAAGEMAAREQFWIDHFDINGGLYNISKLARPQQRGKESTETTRRKISESLKGKKFLPSQIARLVTAHTGKVHSEATKQKMRDSHAARREVARQKAIEQWARPGMRELLSSAKKGGKASEATKQRLSVIALARWMDPVLREHMLRTQMQGKLAKSASK